VKARALDRFLSETALLDQETEDKTKAFMDLYTDQEAHRIRYPGSARRIGRPGGGFEFDARDKYNYEVRTREMAWWAKDITTLQSKSVA
jgi:hypothetical protein